MTLPTLAILVDWDHDGDWSEPVNDITDDVISMDYGRGASFDGESEAPGNATLIVRNDDGRYNPDNASGPYYGNLKPGRHLHVSATYSGTAYGLFYGTLRRITPLARPQTAELYFEDPLYDLSRAETNVEWSTDRSLVTFRGLILDDAGIGTAYRSLDTNVENDIPTTWADRVSAREALEAVNRATASLHYIDPQATTGTAFKYTTLDRTTILERTQNSSETWNRFVGDVVGLDVTDEALVNSQRVTPTGRTLGQVETLWTYPELPLYIGGSATRTFWAGISDPAAEHEITYTFGYGTATVTPTYYGDGAKIVITETSGSAVKFTDLSIAGRPYISYTSAISAALASSVERRDTGLERATSVVITDSTSITDYGTFEGADRSSDLLANLSQATGLGDWVILRYKDPKVRPTIERQDEFPSMLARDIGDCVTVDFDLLDVSSTKYLIRSFRTTVDAKAATWRTTYQLEEALPAGTWFTLDTAGQGLDDGGGGSEGSLAY